METLLEVCFIGLIIFGIFGFICQCIDDKKTQEMLVRTEKKEIENSIASLTPPGIYEIKPITKTGEHISLYKLELMEYINNSVKELSKFETLTAKKEYLILKKEIYSRAKYTYYTEEINEITESINSINDELNVLESELTKNNSFSFIKQLYCDDYELLESFAKKFKNNYIDDFWFLKKQLEHVCFIRKDSIIYILLPFICLKYNLSNGSIIKVEYEKIINISYGYPFDVYEFDGIKEEISIKDTIAFLKLRRYIEFFSVISMDMRFLYDNSNQKRINTFLECANNRIEEYNNEKIRDLCKINDFGKLYDLSNAYIKKLIVPSKVSSISLKNNSIEKMFLECGNVEFDVDCEFNNLHYLEITNNSIMTKLDMAKIKEFKNIEEIAINNNCLNEIYFSDYFNPALKSLVKVVFPKSVKKIGRNSFYGCSSLKCLNDWPLNTFVYYKNIVIESSTFGGTMIDTVVIDGNEAKGQYLNLNVNNNFSTVIIKNSIDFVAFKSLFDTNSGDITTTILCDNEQCNSPIVYSDIQFRYALETIDIPYCVGLINKSTFKYSRKLKKIKIINPYCKVTSKAFDEYENIDIILPSRSIYENLSEKTKESNNITVIDSIIENFTFDGNSDIPKCQFFDTIVINNKKCYDFIVHCKDVKKIVFGEKINKLPILPYHKFSLLKEIVLPKSITTIPKDAFANCEALEIINLDNIESVGECAFLNCSNLKKVGLTDRIKIIGSKAFENCKSLINLELGEVSDIGNDVFSNCSSLKEIKIEIKNSVISERLFFNCVNLENITINDISEVKKSAFENCKSIISFDFIDNVKKIEKESFKGSSISDVSFLFNINEIPSGAFENCVNIKELNIPHTIKTISESAFKGCASIGEVFIPEDIKVIEKDTFKDCISVKRFKGMSGVNIINEGAFDKCQSLTRMIFPQTLEYFNSDFKDCENLKLVVFTNNLKTFHLNMSQNNIEKIYLPKNIESYECIDINRRIDVYTVRGTNWKSMYPSGYIKYQPLQENFDDINKFLLESGYPLMIPKTKIKLSTKQFGDIAINNDILYEDFFQNDKKIEKKRASWDTQTIKEANKTDETYINEEKDKSIKFEIYDGNINIVNLTKELRNDIDIIGDNVIASPLIKINYVFKNNYEKILSVFVNEEDNTISNIMYSSYVLKEATVEHELLDNVKNGKVKLLLINENKIIYEKEYIVDRIFNVEDLFDF